MGFSHLAPAALHPVRTTPSGPPRHPDRSRWLTGNDPLTTFLRMAATENVLPDTATTEADKYGKFVRRIMRAYGRRVADRDIEGLKGMVNLRTELDAQIRDSAQTLNALGYSWAEIGRVLGVSKQAAQQRFGRKP